MEGSHFGHIIKGKFSDQSIYSTNYLLNNIQWKISYIFLGPLCLSSSHFKSKIALMKMVLTEISSEKYSLATLMCDLLEGGNFSWCIYCLERQKPLFAYKLEPFDVLPKSLHIFSAYPRWNQSLQFMEAASRVSYFRFPAARAESSSHRSNSMSKLVNIRKDSKINLHGHGPVWLSGPLYETKLSQKANAACVR